MEKICVLGLGYIGLPVSSLFATHGFKVVGVDIDEENIKRINEGKSLINEPDINILVQTALKSGNLTMKKTPEKADVFIIAVPTPITNKKVCDLSFVQEAGKSIVPFLSKGNLVILESTVPPRTTEDFLRPILEKSGLKAGKDFYLAHCPEKVLPGKILIELVENDRVFGGIDEKSFLLAKKLYSSFVKGEIFSTDAKTAEFVKLIENSYRDVNIAFANELAKLCKKLNIDVWEAIKFANRHPRVKIHMPGPGVGGHCIALDPWFIVEKDPSTAKIIALAREINDGMPEFVVNIIKKHIKGIKEPTIAVLGVAYKSEIDDARESPAKKIISDLKSEGFNNIRIYDPYVKTFKYKLSEDLDSTLKDADCIVIVTDHNVFKNMDAKKISKLVRTKIIIDTRNCTSKENWEANGFKWDTV